MGNVTVLGEREKVRERKRKKANGSQDTREEEEKLRHRENEMNEKKRREGINGVGDEQFMSQDEKEMIM